MKIPPSSARVNGATSTQSGEAGRAKSASGKPATASGGADAVQLSPLSAQLQSLASGVSEPSFDRAKVDEIKQAIREGKLTIRADVVADRMIEDVKHRIGKSDQ